MDAEPSQQEPSDAGHKRGKKCVDPLKRLHERTEEFQGNHAASSVFWHRSKLQARASLELALELEVTCVYS